MSPTDELRAAIGRLPEFPANSLKGLTLSDGFATVVVELTAEQAALKTPIENSINGFLKTRSGITGHTVMFMDKIQTERPAVAPLPGVDNVVAVYACKGGVGKSTVSTNLAVALAHKGYQVGLLDADIHGPNIPLMMGVSERPQVSDKNRITPLVAHGVKVMSLGLLKDASMPMIWRGPMIHGAIQQLLRDTEWGKLDYLVIDLPPGTGDAQLSVTHTVPVSGVIFVTTPQAVSLADGVKGINMFKKLGIKMVGLVENMAGFTCPECHHVTDIFTKGGGAREAAAWGIPLLASIPLDPRIVQGGDSGKPIVKERPDSESAKALLNVVEKVVAAVHS